MLDESKGDKKVPFQVGDPKDVCFSESKDVNIKAISKRLMNEMLQNKDILKKLREDRSIEEIPRMKLLTEKNNQMRNTNLHLNMSFKLLTAMKEKRRKENLDFEQDFLEGELSKRFYETLSNRIVGSEPLHDTYRLLCICSLVFNGLDEKEYEKIRREIFETYGFEQIVTFNRLEHSGLIRKKDKKKNPKSWFESNKKALGLMRDIPANIDPCLINLPYDAYVPVSYKIFEWAVLNGWTDSAKIDAVPGLKEVYGSLENVMYDETRRKVVLVYMVGGITHAEVSYMRKLAEQTNIELLVATTDIINNKEFIRPFINDF